MAQGCDPEQLRLEWPHPQLRGSRIDLVVGNPPEALVELKYPREPNEQNAAWTMALGEVLKDLYRLSLIPTGDKLFVYVETARLRRYMAGAAARYGLNLDVDEVTLEPDAALSLPLTAAQIIGPELVARRVTATRLHVLAIGEDVHLSVYLVAGPVPAGATGATSQAPATVPERAEVSAGSPEPVRVGPEASGVRGEIHRAVRAVLARSGGTTFRLDEVLREMRNAGSRYAESTIRTMVTSHLCANAPDHAAATYRDFERVERAVYRPLSF